MDQFEPGSQGVESKSRYSSTAPKRVLFPQRNSELIKLSKWQGRQIRAKDYSSFQQFYSISRLGLVVMAGDSRLRGNGFETQHQILVGYFFTLHCCKNCLVYMKKTENEAEKGPCFKETILFHQTSSQTVWFIKS